MVVMMMVVMMMVVMVVMVVMMMMMMMMMMMNCVSGVELEGKLGAKRKQTCKSMQELGGKNQTREWKKNSGWGRWYHSE